MSDERRYPEIYAQNGKPAVQFVVLYENEKTFVVIVGVSDVTC